MSIPLLDPCREAELMAAWKERGCIKSRNRILEAYSRLSVAWATKYRSLGLEHGDLVQEGLIGLAVSLDRYDARKGASFGYFAAFHVRASIQTYVVQNMSAIGYKRTGRHKSLVFSIRRFMQRCEAEASATGQYVTASEMHTKAARAFKVTLADVQRLTVMLAHKDKALSEPLSEGAGTTLGDMIADESTLDLDDLLDRRFSDAEISSGLEMALAALPTRMGDIIKRRWLAPEGCVPRLEDLATEYGISRERVRQIEGDGLKRLRILMGRYMAPEVDPQQEDGSCLAQRKPWGKHPRANPRRAGRLVSVRTAESGRHQLLIQAQACH